MKDLKLVAAALAQTPPATPLVLATVVRVEGSTYRRAGARLLVSEERWLAGGVSGGCVERDLLQRAFHRTASAPALAAYDSRSDDGEGWALALGCNGLVEIFLERVVPGGPVHPIETPARWMRAGVAGVLATVIAAPAGVRVGQRLALAARQGGFHSIHLPVALYFAEQVLLVDIIAERDILKDELAHDVRQNDRLRLLLNLGREIDHFEDTLRSGKRRLDRVVHVRQLAQRLDEVLGIGNEGRDHANGDQILQGKIAGFLGNDQVIRSGKVPKEVAACTTFASTASMMRLSSER